jgi:hypothetical protein
MSTGVTPIDDAIAAKKLRLYWDAMEEAGAPDKALVLAALWLVIRGHKAPPDTSQDERLEVRAVVPDGGGAHVIVRYVFDADFNSQYDKTVVARIEIRVALSGAGAALRTRAQPQG